MVNRRLAVSNLRTTGRRGSFTHTHSITGKSVMVALSAMSASHLLGNVQTRSLATSSTVGISGLLPLERPFVVACALALEQVLAIARIEAESHVLDVASVELDHARRDCHVAFTSLG